MVFTTSTNIDRAFLARRAQIRDLLIAVGDHLHHLPDTAPLSQQAGTLPPKPEGWPNHREIRGSLGHPSPSSLCRLFQVDIGRSPTRGAPTRGCATALGSGRTASITLAPQTRGASERTPTARNRRTTVREQSSLNAFGRCLHHLPRTDTRSHIRPLTSHRAEPGRTFPVRHTGNGVSPQGAAKPPRRWRGKTLPV